MLLALDHLHCVTPAIQGTGMNCSVGASALCTMTMRPRGGNHYFNAENPRGYEGG